METDTALLISLLVLVCFVILLLVLIYGKVLAIYEFYRPTTPPPASLRFTDSFLSTDHPGLRK
jgi:hypothetical protein